jgi:hypothetical protein
LVVGIGLLLLFILSLPLKILQDLMMQENWFVTVVQPLLNMNLAAAL